MEVLEVVDGMVVKPNCAYIIPPNHDMAFLNGTLQLLTPTAPRGHRLPIDFFFRSLAQDQHERAICVVLSGTGRDGTLGVRAVKAEGGMVMAQKPESTEYRGMPASAISTGLVDYVLPVAEMPAKLMAYATHAFRDRVQRPSPAAGKAEDALKKIFVLLRAQVGHDFSQYKPTTTGRRIERRMAVHAIDHIDGYVRYLQQTPAEGEALFRDLLIGVTSFFRDMAAFAALQEYAIPRLFAGKPEGTPIRVWVPGCSTGEEAYSIAILIQEHLATLKKSFKLQLFATDIDPQAIEWARAGVYPASIDHDVSAERRARFFVREADGASYRIHKSIRDAVIFSEQSVIKDPPFSRLDLISCRNLLIYLGPELQRKIIALFHYALSPGGTLFLGTSESVGEFDYLFAPADRKSNQYLRKDSVRASTGLGLFPSVRDDSQALDRPLIESGRGDLALGWPAGRDRPERGPAGAQGDLLYLQGHTGRYLETNAGEADLNIVKMAREGLRGALGMALVNAATNGQPVRHDSLKVKTSDGFIDVSMTVQPVSAESNPRRALGTYLVTFEEAPDAAPQPASPPAPSEVSSGAKDPTTDSTQLDALKKELQAKERHLQTVNEELTTFNEEMQSVNEEMQSTNEELQTSKEELQSVNEELDTVNSELQTKVADLSRSNNDMINLLAGTGIGTLFVDHQQRIQRFTPAITQVINLILTDIGRPLGHMSSNLVGYDRLEADVQAVLDTLQPKEFEVETRKGAWYLLRILPYRTLENVIEGAVISFIEITEMKAARTALQESHSLRRLAVVVRDSRDAITVHDLEGRILAWNPGAERIYGWSEAEALQMNIRQMVPQSRRKESMDLIRKQSAGEVLKPYTARRLAKDGRIVEVSLIATKLVNASGTAYAIATTEREIVDGPRRAE